MSEFMLSHRPDVIDVSYSILER